MQKSIAMLALLLAGITTVGMESTADIAPPMTDRADPEPVGEVDGWDTPFNVSNDPYTVYQTYPYQNPSCVDAQGNFYVSWYDTQLSYYRIMVRRWVRATATWDTAWTISHNTVNYAYRSGIAVDANGVLHAVWYSSTSGYYGIYYNNYNPATGTFGYLTDTCIYNPGGNYLNYYPSIACRPGGSEIHVAWQQRVASPVYYNACHMERNPTTGAWSTPTVVDTGYYYAYQVGVDVDANNDVYITYRQGIYNISTTYYAAWLVKRTSGVWGNPEGVSYPALSLYYAYAPDVEVTPAGVAHVVWYGYESGASRYMIYYRERSALGVWGQIETLSTEMSYYQYYPCVESRADTIDVVWYGADPANPTYYQVCYRRKIGTGAWSPIERPTGHTGNYNYYPSVRNDGYGNVHVTWYDNSSGYNDVWHLKRAPDAPNNMALDAIVEPTGFYANTSVTPAVRIRNVGTAAQSNIPVYVTADSAGTTVYSANTSYAGPLNPGDTVTVSFGTSFDVGGRGIPYSVTSWTLLGGDADPSDDTLTFSGHTIGEPHRYFEFEWAIPHHTIYTVASIVVQDTLVWVASGGIAGTTDPNYFYRYDTRSLALVDSFLQPNSVASAWGIRDMWYDEVNDKVYGGAESNTMYVIDGTSLACVDTIVLTGTTLPSVVRALTCDGDSMYTSGFSTPYIKFAKDGTNCHQIAPAGASTYGLAYDATRGLMYQTAAGAVPNPLTEFSFPDWTDVLDTVLPYINSTHGGCETFRGDTFLLVQVQGVLDSVVCFRLIPQELDYGVAEIVSPVGDVDTNTWVVPAARWQNFHTSQVNRFDAWYFLEDPLGNRVHSEGPVAVFDLTPGEDTTLIFMPYNVGADTGTWTAKCSTYAKNDVGATNDVLTSTFRVVLASQPPLPGGWTEITQVPLAPSGKAVKDGGWIAWDALNAKYYVAKAYKTSDFYSYEPVTQTWTTLPSWPLGTEAKPPYKGAVGVSDGNGTIYATKGNNRTGFWKYTVADSTWTQLTDVPLGLSNKKVKGGTDMVYVHDDTTGWVYLLKGYKTEFYRYNTLTSQWQTLADAPIGVKAKYDKGSWLVYDEDNAKIYAHKAKYSELYAYSLDSMTWGPLIPGMPLANGQTGKNKKAKDGSDAVKINGYVYSLKGGNTIDFYSLDLTTLAWAERETIPSVGTTLKKKRVKGGGSMATDGVRITALKGNKTLEVWQYNFGTVAAARPERSGVMADRTVRAAGFSLGPNPLAANTATLRYSLPKAGPVNLRVFDVTGRTVLDRSLVAGRVGTTELDLRGLSAGIYLVKLTADGHSSTHKLVIQH
jgi:hypothetical protein